MIRALHSTPNLRKISGFEALSDSPACYQLLSDYRHGAFNLPLVFRGANLCKIGNKAKETLKLTICPVDCRIVQMRLHNTAFKIIKKYSFRDTAEELERPDTGLIRTG